MRIEAVIICKNYSDFLKHSLPRNLNHLDHVVVVTSPDDKATKDLCNHYGVVCVDTDIFTEWGDKFNKGRAINVGINYLRRDDWILHLDADIVLPDHFRKVMNMAHLDPTCIYGADRLNVRDYENWDTEKDKCLQYSDGCHVQPHQKFGMGSRLLHGDYGYCPIGFFQLHHGSQNRKYSGSGGSGEHTDVMFALQWPRIKRILLPQFFVYHLEVGGEPMGLNWEGRKSRPFGPKHHEHHHEHHHHGHHHHHHKNCISFPIKKTRKSTS
jgi:glycosyltransferase involved in cell wall biosynthesis